MLTKEKCKESNLGAKSIEVSMLFIEMTLGWQKHHAAHQMVMAESKRRIDGSIALGLVLGVCLLVTNDDQARPIASDFAQLCPNRARDAHMDRVR
jgi:hypothetical protein